MLRTRPILEDFDWLLRRRAHLNPGKMSYVKDPYVRVYEYVSENGPTTSLETFQDCIQKYLSQPRYLTWRNLAEELLQCERWWNRGYLKYLHRTGASPELIPTLEARIREIEFVLIPEAQRPERLSPFGLVRGHISADPMEPALKTKSS